MIKIIFALLTLFTVEFAYSATKYDLSKLSGSWTSETCSRLAGKIDITADSAAETVLISSRDSKTEYKNIDKGGIVEYGESCSWGFCDKYKYKNKVASTKNGFTAQSAQWAKGPLDIFWTAKTAQDYIYELLPTGELQVNSRDYSSQYDYKSECTYKRTN